MDKIKQMLFSEDIEMVKLGAILLTQEKPRSEWEKNLVFARSFNSDGLPVIYKWTFTIFDNNIEIEPLQDIYYSNSSALVKDPTKILKLDYAPRKY